MHGYEALAEQAAQKNLPYCDFLEQVLESEANVRQERNIKVRTQLAGFPDLKRLEQFDFKFPSSIDEKKIRELASLRFLERHENAVFLGPPGVGKTHWAVSLGMEAIGHGFSVYFVRLPDLLDRLVQAQAILGLRLHQAVEQIRQADEVNTEAVTNGFHAQGDRQVGLAHPGRPKKQGVLVTLQETQTRQFADLLLVDGGRELEVKLLQPLDVRKASQLRAHFDVSLLPDI